MILSTSNQFIAIIPTAAGAEWLDLEAFVKDAEIYIKTELLGTALYALLEDTTDPNDAELLDLAIRVIAYKAYGYAIPFLDVSQSKQGFGVVSTQNLAPASKERVDKLIAANMAMCDKSIDYLVEYLEITTTYHDDWKGSKAFMLLSDSLIYRMTEFKRLVNWDNGYKAFIALQAELRAYTTLKIADKISDEYTQHLIEAQIDGDLTAADIKVLTWLKPALANYVLGNNAIGDKFLNKAISYMDANLELYDLYAASNEYLLRATYGGHINEEDSTIFVSN